jgi:hypothetical protein
MKNLLLLFSLTFCLGLNAVAQNRMSFAKKTTDVKADILSLEQANNKAKIAGNKVTLNQLYADDFAGVNAAGGPSTKADIVDFYGGDGSVMATHSTDDLQIRVFDKTAVVTARLTYKYNDRMQDQTVNKMKYTRIYVFRTGKWQIVAEHFCFLDAN